MVHQNNFNFLRLLFASFVILSHSFVLLNLGDDEPLMRWTGDVLFSEVGVFGFFVISGYLIYESFVKSRSLLDYFRKRAYRVLPALLVVVFCSTFILGPLLTDLPFLTYVNSPGTWRYWLSNSFLIPFSLSLPGVFTFNPNTSAVNGSLWTLRYEFLFYGLVATLVILPKKFYSLICLTLSIAFLILFSIRSFLDFEFLEGYVHNFFELGFYFSMGMVLSIFKELVLRKATLIFWVSLIVYFFALFFLAHKSILSMVSFPFLIITFGSFYFKSLDYSKYTGDISYGTYIYAFPVQQILISKFAITSPLILFLPSLFLAWGFGYLSFNYIERYFVKKRVPKP